MVEQEYEKEYSDVKKRRKINLGNLFKNLNNWQFIGIIVLGIILIYMIDSGAELTQIFVIGFAMIMILIYSQKQETGLISEEVAKRIAIETLENKKEEYHIETDADIKCTNFCVLQYHDAKPFKWHIGIKIENGFNKIDYWRVIIHPYEGIVLGIVNEPTGFDGNERNVKDVVVVFPEHYMAES